MRLSMLVPVRREGMSLLIFHFLPIFARFCVAFEGLFSRWLSAILALLAWNNTDPLATLGGKGAYFP